MVGEWKGSLLLEIQPDARDVKIHRTMKFVYPLASALAIFGTAIAFYYIYDGDIPSDMLFLLALLVPMAIFADVFSLSISTPFASPIKVYTNGLEFKSTWFGKKMGLPGFIPKDNIDRIELVLEGGVMKTVGLFIWLKNKRVQVIRRRNNEDFIKLAKTLESSLGIKVLMK